jgi:hypothetical protein
MQLILENNKVKFKISKKEIDIIIDELQKQVKVIEMKNKLFVDDEDEDD